MVIIDSRTQYATHESKELHRIRSSLSFRFAVLLTEAFRNPLKILTLPLTIPRELIFRKPKKYSLVEPKANSIVIVGVDTRGTLWSERAMKLSIELQRYDSDLRISLLTTSDNVLKDRVGKLLHYRIPRPRSVDSSRRDWNLTCERLLSTVIHLQEASRVVFLGDFLYSGIRHSLNSSPSGVHLHWINSGNNQIGIEKITVSSSTSIYEDSHDTFDSEHEISEFTIQDHLNLRLDQTILAHIQLSSSALNTWEGALESSLKYLSKKANITTASHRRFGFLADTIDIPKHVQPFSIPGFHFRIIEDDPDLISKVNVDRIPTLILRTDRVQNKVSLKILEEMERFCVAIVMRRPNRLTLIDALESLTDLESRKKMITNRSKTSSSVSEQMSWTASMHSLVVGD